MIFLFSHGFSCGFPLIFPFSPWFFLLFSIALWTSPAPWGPRSTAERSAEPRPAELLRAAVEEASLEAAELAYAHGSARRGEMEIYIIIYPWLGGSDPERLGYPYSQHMFPSEWGAVWSYDGVSQRYNSNPWKILGTVNVKHLF